MGRVTMRLQLLLLLLLLHCILTLPQHRWRRL